MLQDWTYISFLHWRVDPAVMRSLVPDELTLDLFDGSAWVGLVPFYMRIQVGPVPPIPYLTVFPETNVRTYVHGPDGRAGVWFLSLDIPRLSGTLGARAAYALPYMWSAMDVQRGRHEVSYRCRRLWYEWPLATSSFTVGVGDEIPAGEVSELEYFLTARWRLYAKRGPTLLCAPVEHPDWRLHRAGVRSFMDSLIVAAGLPEQDSSPLVHFSPGVRARIGLPRSL